jgi:GT2 family glycosyltransferase
MLGSKRKISIIIPVMRLKKTKNSRYFYKSVWGIRETVNSIIQTTVDLDYEFVFVQNGVDEELTVFLKSVLSEHSGRLIQISENVGVAKAWNIGVSACLNEVLVISNDDVEFRERSINVLVDELFNGDKVGQVGPEGGDWYRDSSGERRGKDQVESVDEISGYFFITTRTAYNTVGGFDEIYSPAGVEEIDYSFALRRAGFLCLVIPNSGIVHHGHHGVSAKSQVISFLGTSIDTHSLDKRNKEYFIKKWY